MSSPYSSLRSTPSGYDHDDRREECETGGTPRFSFIFSRFTRFLALLSSSHTFSTSPPEGSRIRRRRGEEESVESRRSETPRSREEGKGMFTLTVTASRLLPFPSLPSSLLLPPRSLLLSSGSLGVEPDGTDVEEGRHREETGRQGDRVTGGNREPSCSFLGFHIPFLLPCTSSSRSLVPHPTPTAWKNWKWNRRCNDNDDSREKVG